MEERTIRRSLECGDPHHGFARICWYACGQDYLLALSCKTRCFCPSCHQKRALLYGEWVAQEILVPVAHRQYMLTVPRLVRPLLRATAGGWGLCRIADRLIVQAHAAVLREGRPALIVFVQSFA